MSQATDEALGALSGIAATNRGLSLLVLFGSRARRDSREGSDWDLGYLAGPEMDTSALLLDVVTGLGTDRVDLVDLARAAGFRNVVAQADDQLDLARVLRAAREGPRDLEAFLAVLRDRLSPAAGG